LATRVYYLLANFVVESPQHKTLGMNILIATVLVILTVGYDIQIISETSPSAKTDTPAIEKTVNLDVPFMPQAPHGNWNLPYQEACEETSIIMVEHYLSGEKLTPARADTDITEMVDWETENGLDISIGAVETLKVASVFYDLKGDILYNKEVTLSKIKQLLSEGHPIIIPVAGQVLANPNYGGEGPPYHMIVLKGYDETHFITHDPGTQLGANHRYTYETIYNAIHDWTGSNSTIDTGRKAMLVLYSS